jgi:hypothetical protein
VLFSSDDHVVPYRYCGFRADKRTSLIDGCGRQLKLEDRGELAHFALENPKGVDVIEAARRVVAVREATGAADMVRPSPKAAYLRRSRCEYLSRTIIRL